MKNHTGSHYPSTERGTTFKFFFLFILLLLVLLVLSAFRQDAAVATWNDEGERVFNQVCATCHKLDPPANMDEGMPIAPPMRMIMMRYGAAFETEEARRIALEAWLEQPDPERSVLPAHAIEEHGLMPPLTITVDERKAVVTYILGLKPGSGKMNMKGMMQHEGDGMQHGKMDSTGQRRNR